MRIALSEENVPLSQASVVSSAYTADQQLPRSVLVGLVGSGIQLSRTPRMHEIEGQRLGLKYVYQLFDTGTRNLAAAKIEQIVQAAQLCGFAGLNITFPFKKTVVPLVNRLSDNAKRVGAVNTLVFRDGVTYGHNTDLWGYAESFRRKMQGVNLDCVVQLGAGGAGAAVSHALLQLGVRRLLIADTNAKRASELAARLADEFDNSRVENIEPDDVGRQTISGIVNTTPVGMASNPGMPIDHRALSSDIWVSDIVYFPLETELLRSARQMGCKTLGGGQMAVFQAVRAFEIFTNITPDHTRMRAVFDAF